MSLQGGFQEKNVVFNEERLFQKIPYFQETTLTPRNITSFPVGAGGMMESQPAGPDSDAAQPLLSPGCLHSTWETTKVHLN